MTHAISWRGRVEYSSEITWCRIQAYRIAGLLWRLIRRGVALLDLPIRQNMKLRWEWQVQHLHSQKSPEISLATGDCTIRLRLDEIMGELPSDEKRIFTTFDHSGKIIYCGIRICISAHCMTKYRIHACFWWKHLLCHNVYRRRDRIQFEFVEGEAVTYSPSNDPSSDWPSKQEKRPIRTCSMRSSLTWVLICEGNTISVSKIGQVVDDVIWYDSLDTFFLAKHCICTFENLLNVIGCQRRQYKHSTSRQ